ncbi:MAG: DUF3011 domain-containing protein [Rhodanobacteraceae bacterium]
MNGKCILSLLLVAGGLLVPLRQADAQRYDGGYTDRDISLSCESQDQHYHLCRVDPGQLGTVRLAQRLSRASCVRGRSWGFNRAGVWVDHGCRARFVVSRRGGYREGGYGDRPTPGGRDAAIRFTCQSNDQRYRFCKVDLGPGGTARIEKQLSSARCIRGRSWGYNRAGVWVDQGCRARFVVVRQGWNRAGRIPDSGYRSARPSQPMSLTCQSEDQHYRLCRVELGRRGTARIQQRLSHASCVRGQSWGFNRAGVWVDHGCRARFAVIRRR